MASQVFSSNGVRIIYDSNAPEVIEALKNAAERGLAVIGEKAVGHAQDKCPVDTGRLRASITYAVQGEDCYIGTNVEYAPYIEFGTGVHAESGGRQTPWSYKDAKGVWHRTNGSKPQPFLRPACSDHVDEYLDILKESLINA